MNKSIEHLDLCLQAVDTASEFKTWVRHELRRVLPHAAFLTTVGRLYGVGSVATHRLDVDFPLSLVEELKNSAGALDDPMIYGWFRSERLRYVDLREVDEFGSQQQWRRVLIGFGIREVIVHGVLDHVAKRFAVFQMCNPFVGDSPEVARMFSSLVQKMATASWRAVDCRDVRSSRHLVGHPTLMLTPTELHIIELLAQGLSNKEIARLRGVSDSTVKTQVQRTGAKLGATRRAEIVAIAMPMLSPLPAQTLIDYGDSKIGRYLK